jgi:hypothetical protein
VAPERDPLLQALDDAVEFARTYRFELTDEYLALIEQVEAMPRNQNGADKSGRWLGSKADHAAWRALVQAPREER